MAYAPLVGQDGGSRKSDLPDEASRIFFAPGLDDPNRLELAREIRANAHSVFRLRPRGKPGETSRIARRANHLASFCRPIFLMQVGPPCACAVHSHSGPKPARKFCNDEGTNMKAAPTTTSTTATSSSVRALPARSGFHRGQFITSKSAIAQRTTAQPIYPACEE